MKQLIIITLIFALNNYSYSQLTISCNYREICKMDYYTEEYSDCYKYEENSLFEFNEDETVMIHTTESIKSAYYIKSKSKDESSGTWTFEVVSDVGNKYIYLLNPAKNIMGTASRDDDGTNYIIIFHIKAIW